MAKLFIVEGGMQALFDAEPGAMLRTPENDIEGRFPAWLVKLPGEHTYWQTNQGDPPWEVAGEPPKITVKPSIHVMPDGWHGFITNGEMTP
jgi:hypothetical protein